MPNYTPEDVDLIRYCGLFDADWYLAENPAAKVLGMDPVEHYLWIGDLLGRNPSPQFDARQYGSLRPEIDPRSTNRLLHFLRNEPVDLQPSSPVVVFTVLTGGYEAIKEPKVRDPSVRYILFSDRPVSAPTAWEVVQFDTMQLSPRRASRLPKLLPHRYLPEHAISVYIDSSLTIRERNIAKVANDRLGAKHLAAYPHYKRRCVFSEMAECLKLGLSDPRQTAALRSKFEATEFPQDFGLLENAFLIRRNTPMMRAINELWHRMYTEGPERDQFYLMYLLWKYRVPYSTITNASNFRESPYVEWASHSVRRASEQQARSKLRLINWQRSSAA